jgi:site-specific recombinase XerD
MNATRRFGAWCAQRNLDELSVVQPFHVAAFIKDLQAEVSPPTVKQHLAALRMLFDWLVTGHVIDVNPAHAVRGPKYVVKKGKTPVLTADEARTLLDSIPIVKAAAEDGAAAAARSMTFPVTTIFDHFLDEYIAAAGIADDAGGYLFRTKVRK